MSAQPAGQITTGQITGRVTWQAVRDEVLRRINTRTWAPGAMIPNEAALAAEFGCARATVNRALRAVADAGLIDRRRKAGSRVALQPVARATLEISVIRQEIEAAGAVYGYELRTREEAPLPDDVATAMGVAPGAPTLHLVAVHASDGRPYVLEDRWISVAEVPRARDAPFERTSGNEWLLANAPYTHGEIAISAADAGPAEAAALGLAPGGGILVIERTTWNHAAAITRVRLCYPPGHRLRTSL